MVVKVVAVSGNVNKVKKIRITITSYSYFSLHLLSNSVIIHFVYKYQKRNSYIAYEL